MINYIIYEQGFIIVDNVFIFTMLLFSFFIYFLLHYIVCDICRCRIVLPYITFGFMYFLYFTCFVILQFCW